MVHGIKGNALVGAQGHPQQDYSHSSLYSIVLHYSLPRHGVGKCRAIESGGDWRMLVLLKRATS